MIDYLKVQKTARVVTEGANNPKLRSVWLIAHGYGQLATFFINKFEKLYSDENLFVDFLCTFWSVFLLKKT